MSDASLPPPAPPRPPPPPNLRPPPPGPVVWLGFLFGPPVVLMIGCMLVALGNGPQMTRASDLGPVLIAAAVAGVVLGVCGVGGLALASRFYNGLGARILGGLLLGVALLIGLAGVAFAGCMCVVYSSRT